MSKIRILQFPIANSRGGLTQYVLNNWKWMDRKRFQCDFATMSTQLDFENEILETGSKVYHISCYAEENQEQFIKEFEDILSQDYDVVHIHTKQWKSFLIEELCIKYNVPKIIVHSHSTGIDIEDSVKRKKEEETHRKIKRIFNESFATDFWACSKAAAKFLFGEQIEKSKIRIMPNAIDLDKFAFNVKVRSEIREKYGLSDCFVMGHVGRFEYQKNHEFLIKIFFRILKQIESARLILVGDGEYFQKVLDEAENLNIANKILFLGKRTDVNDWYQAMDVFCLPSRFEGLPISMIEAQASGLPCIGSDCITKEVKICNNVYLLPLNEEIWVNMLLKVRGVNRENNKEKLVEFGYEIKTQIKEIETAYTHFKERKK